MSISVGRDGLVCVNVYDFLASVGFQVSVGVWSVKTGGL